MKVSISNCSGKFYNWIIANQELRTSDLVVRKNETRTLLITRRRIEKNTPNSEMQSPDRVISEDWAVFSSIDRSIEYFEDVFNLFAKTINNTGQNYNNWGGLKTISCFDPEEYVTLFPSGKRISDILRQTPSFEGATGKSHANLLSTIHFLPSSAVLKIVRKIIGWTGFIV